MSIFVDSSAWFAAAARGDRHNSRAKQLLATDEPLDEPLVTSDHVLVETWRLIHHHLSECGRDLLERPSKRYRDC